MSDQNNKQDTGIKVVELNKFTAAMFCNTSQIERTGKPLTDIEFNEIYDTLPNIVRIEFEGDISKPELTKDEQKALGSLLGKSSTFRAKAREREYDEVAVMLELNTPGKVTAFNKSGMLKVDGTPVTEESFQAPESAETGNKVYESIIEEVGVYGVYAENRGTKIDGYTPSKTSKMSASNQRLTPEQTGNRVIKLESVVPITCKSLFTPSKASVFTFISSKSQDSIDEFLAVMKVKFGFSREQTLVQLLGLFGQVKQDDVDTMMEVLNNNEVLVGQVESYRIVMSELLSSMCDDGAYVEASINANGTFDMQQAVDSLLEHNQSFRTLIENGKQAYESDKCMKVIAQQNPDKLVLGILSNYIPMVITEFSDMGPNTNIEFIWSLMELIGGVAGNNCVSVTVKDCDLVAFGTRL